MIDGMPSTVSELQLTGNFASASIRAQVALASAIVGVEWDGVDAGADATTAGWSDCLGTDEQARAMLRAMRKKPAGTHVVPVSNNLVEPCIKSPLLLSETVGVAEA